MSIGATPFNERVGRAKGQSLALSEFGRFLKVQRILGRSLLLIKVDIGLHLYPVLVCANMIPVLDEKLGATSRARHESLLASACALVDV